jgi:hypothetical protein
LVGEASGSGVKPRRRGANAAQGKLQRPLGEPELFIFLRFFTDFDSKNWVVFGVDLKLLVLIIKIKELASNKNHEGIYLKYQSYVGIGDEIEMCMK